MIGLIIIMALYLSIRCIFKDFLKLERVLIFLTSEGSAFQIIPLPHEFELPNFMKSLGTTS